MIHILDETQIAENYEKFTLVLNEVCLEETVSLVSMCRPTPTCYFSQIQLTPNATFHKS